MKTRRIFQVASALPTILFAIALLALSVLAILPFLGTEMKGFAQTLGDGIAKVVSEISFLQGLKNGLGGIVFVLVSLVVPALLLLTASLILFSKPRKSQGKYVFAAIIAMLGTLLFTVIFELYAKKIFGDATINWMIGIGAGAVLLLFLLVMSLVCKAPKVAEQTETEQVAATAETEQAPVTDNTVRAEQVAPIEMEVVEPMPTQEPTDVTTPETTATVEKSTPIATDYVPNERNTVTEIMENTYGKKSEELSPENLKKIRKLRGLLDSKAITEQEYIKLVDAYLNNK